MPINSGKDREVLQSVAERARAEKTSYRPGRGGGPTRLVSCDRHFPAFATRSRIRVGGRVLQRLRGVVEHVADAVPQDQ